MVRKGTPRLDAVEYQLRVMAHDIDDVRRNGHEAHRRLNEHQIACPHIARELAPRDAEREPSMLAIAAEAAAWAVVCALAAYGLSRMIDG